jgi:hypothetical protein
MPATGPEFTRRALLLTTFGAVAARLRADSEDQVRELISAMASALTRGSGSEFLAAFDRTMAGFEELRSNVTALLAQAEVQSSVELVSNDGNDRKRTLEADWLLRITGHDNVSGAANREKRVKCQFEKQNKGWRIVSFEPLSLFAAPPVK